MNPQPANLPSRLHFGRWSGLAAIFGGCIWISTGDLLILRPAAIWPITQRPVYDLLPRLGLGSLFILVGFAYIYSLLARQLPAWAKWGFMATAIGSASFAVSGLAFLSGFSRTGLWVFVFTEPFFRFVLGVSGVIVGGGALRVNHWPGWIAFLLVIGSLVLLLFDTQDYRAWLALPFGGVWLILGSTLWVSEGLL